MNNTDSPKRRQPSALLEFTIVLLLIAAAMVFAWNVDFSFMRKQTTSDKKDTSTATAKNTDNNSPEYTRWKEGRALFKSNCAACHNPKTEGTGPILLGSVERWRNAGSYNGKTGEQWLKAWIRNWNEPVQAGYPYAVEMANTRPMQMNVFASLKDEDIDLILLYSENPDGVPVTQ
ncbi:MAG: cytochrome c [Chitinophagales bacterium]|nr:cytochrome c [Chitinophagales bacterium]